jgi:hypothetical protein
MVLMRMEVGGMGGQRRGGGEWCGRPCVCAGDWGP